jgi:hypothetical protein
MSERRSLNRELLSIRAPATPTIRRIAARPAAVIGRTFFGRTATSTARLIAEKTAKENPELRYPPRLPLVATPK